MILTTHALKTRYRSGIIQDSINRTLSIPGEATRRNRMK